MVTIGASVGIGGTNTQADVDKIRGLLRRHSRWLIPLALPSETGAFDDLMGEAIKRFQLRAGAIKRPDGRVDPNGFTLKRLNLATIPEPKHKVFNQASWPRTGPGLGEADFKAAATTLNCEVAAIRAVAEVEVSSRGAWESGTGRPTILFERHKFRNHSRSEFNRSHPDLSGPYSPQSYGRFSDQYPKLFRAAMLDETAALKAASWGAFQILGENHADAGHSTVAAFVDAMLVSERKHLDAFVAFIKANAKMHKALKDKDWAEFASRYNGPDYKKNNYDTKMAAAYKKHAPAKEPAESQ